MMNLSISRVVARFGTILPLAITLVCVASTWTMSSARADELVEKPISYTQQIEPIFRANCQGCHQPAKAQGDFVMTDYDALLIAGESGDLAVVPGKPEESYLMAQIVPVDGESAMPKKGKSLAAADLELIRQWIAEGAKNDSPPAVPKYDAENPPRYTRPPVVTALSYSPDGKWLASSGFQEVLLISTENWSTQRRLIGLSERIESLSFSPDSQRLAVTGGSPGRLGEVQVWDVASGELLLSHQVTYDTVYGGCFSPDGKLIAFGCTDNTVRAIDSVSGEQKLHQGAHDDWIRACGFNPDGSHLVSAGRDMTVKLTEVETERFVDNITSITPGALRGGVNALAMHPVNNEVLVGGADGRPKIYRIFRETERKIGDDANLIRNFPEMLGRIFSVAISRDGSFFAAASTLDGASRVQVYPYDFTGTLPAPVKAAMAKRVADRNDEEKKLVEEYTSQTSEAVATLELPQTSLYALAFSSDMSSVAVGGSDGLVRVFEILTGKITQEFSPVALMDSNQTESVMPGELRAARGLPPNSNSLPDLDAELAALPRAKLLEIDVQPKQIRLSSSHDYVQLTVTAIYASGQKVDATRLVNVSHDNAHVSVSNLGLIRPISAGQTELKLALGDVWQTVSVEVGDMTIPPKVDFVRDVNPLLSRLGCNAGTCHGAQKGKNGFKLSLRGYDPLEDIRALSDDLSSRRLNTAAPDASLMLLKTLGMVPHEGGVLFSRDSIYYDTLRRWIAAGAQLNPESRKVARIELTPEKPVIDREKSWQQFRVVAHYPDGSSRDVTHEAFIESGDAEVCKNYDGGRVQAIRRGEAPILARYEGAYAAATVTVMGDREGFVFDEPEAYSQIDRLVADKWELMKILPSQLCDDHEFLRRVRLDLTGLPPTVEELKAFLADSRPSKLKRQSKIDELIGCIDYIEHWTNKWADLLQVNSKFIGADGAKAFREWIRASVAVNRPYDQFVKDVLTASGSNKENPAASYFKILREPDAMMENTTHLFLAIRFNCNKCHDHPFERWTQDQYYELAAYFAQTGLKADPAAGDKKIGGTAVEGAKPLYEEIFDKNEGEMKHVRTGKDVAPSFPFDCDFAVKEGASRREQLAAWITSRDNPYFAKSFVNRLWGYLTGSGLMEPLDDIRAGNPPTNPELLEHLTDEFRRSDFNVEHVLRLICNSRTYQMSIDTNSWNEDDTLNYSHAKARRLPAEVLYDALYRVTGAISEIPGVERGTRAAMLPDVAVQLADGFLNNLGRPVRESACECERSNDLQLGPIMALVSGPTVGKAISDPTCALPILAKTELTAEQLVGEIYLRVLSRDATPDEIAAIVSSADQIPIDHERLQVQVNERTTWWTSEKAILEQKRLASLEQTQQALKARELEIAPERERLEKERLEKLAIAENSLADYTTGSVELSNKYLADAKQPVHWYPLAPEKLKASSGGMLFPQADRSIVASGKSDKGTYTITYRTPLTGIRGFRLEALTLAGIPGGGPGLSGSGNFVVTEIELEAAPIGAPQEKKRIVLTEGIADFSQEGFDPKQVFDGQTRDQRGWAVSPRGGCTHWANFKTAEKISNENGSLLTFTIHQFHNAEEHRLAHFRISVTTDDGELTLGLPEEFSALAVTSVEQRTAENLAGLIAYLEKSDQKWSELRQAAAQAKQPLAEDGPLVALREKEKNLAIETPDDPKLVQLRTDLAASALQVGNQRLTLAQDLTWALINSPAFLFNH